MDMKKHQISVIILAVVTAIAGTYFFKQVKAAPGLADSTSQFAAESVPRTMVDGYQPGDVAADFSLKNVDDKMVGLSSFPAAKGFIVVFTCNHCPFSKAYEDRIIALNEKFAAQGYPVIAINPNDPEAYEEDSFENMKKRATEKAYTFPYLEDTKNIGQAYGAIRTPHVFVIKKEGGQNIVKYIGTIDDNAQDAAAVSKRYVEDAVNNLLVGKPVILQTTKAIGCAIKWRDNS